MTEIRKVGVVGLGTMGAGIAQVVVQAGLEAVGRDVTEELGARGLLFVDSRTTPLSVAAAEAHRRGVPSTGRDVFLDNVADVARIRAQLRHAETIARRTGAAIAIGHPYPETVAALAEWLPTLEERGFALVPVTTVVARRLCRDGTLPAACRAYAALQTPVN